MTVYSNERKRGEQKLQSYFPQHWAKLWLASRSSRQVELLFFNASFGAESFGDVMCRPRCRRVTSGNFMLFTWDRLTSNIRGRETLQVTDDNHWPITVRRSRFYRCTFSGPDDHLSSTTPRRSVNENSGTQWRALTSNKTLFSAAGPDNREYKDITSVIQRRLQTCSLRLTFKFLQSNGQAYFSQSEKYRKLSKNPYVSEARAPRNKSVNTAQGCKVSFTADPARHARYFRLQYGAGPYGAGSSVKEP